MSHVHHAHRVITTALTYSPVLTSGPLAEGLS
jgi:hypothetical protein